MYKDKDKQREAAKIAMRRHREAQKGITEGITSIEGITPPVTRKGITTAEGITAGITDYPHIIDKLVDPKWRANLSYLCSHFTKDQKEVTWLGDYNLSLVCDLLQCTS
jgi:hypothetical protein